MQYNKKSVEDIDVSGKKVIARCDFTYRRTRTATSPTTSASVLRWRPSTTCWITTLL